MLITTPVYQFNISEQANWQFQETYLRAFAKNYTVFSKYFIFLSGSKDFTDEFKDQDLFTVVKFLFNTNLAPTEFVYHFFYVLIDEREDFQVFNIAYSHLKTRNYLIRTADLKDCTDPINDFDILSEITFK